MSLVSTPISHLLSNQYKSQEATLEIVSPFNVVLDDFDIYCEEVIHKHEKKTDEPPEDELDPTSNLHIDTVEDNFSREVGTLSAQLSFWIYTVSDPLPEPTSYQHNNLKPEWIYKRIVPSKSTQIVQWALLRHSKLPKHAYLVFKGSSPDLIFDTIADTGVIPIPIFCDKNDKTYWDFAAHSGMYSTLMRDFHDIWRIIKTQIDLFDTIIVCGHSLGGGVSILFALETIINEYLAPNKNIVVLTFGSPTVISYENKFNQLSSNSQQILTTLHNMCHCFVNKLDPVPRLPSRSEWTCTVIPYAIRRVIRGKVSASYGSLMWSMLNYGAKSAQLQFVKTAGRYMDVLQSYQPVGTYYFAVDDGEQPHITEIPEAINDILGYIPPHKIIDSAGNAIRVCHYATATDGLEMEKKEIDRFSLRYLRDLTKLMGDTEEEREPEDVDKEIQLLDLLTTQNDYDGEWNQHMCIYTVMQSDDEEVNKQIQRRKMSGRHWLELVSNHMMGQYVTLFTHIEMEPFILQTQVSRDNTSDTREAVREKDRKSIMRNIRRSASEMMGRFGKNFKNKTR